MSIEILKTAQEWSKQGRKVALATVSDTWGSAPFPSGSQLAVDDGGHFVGSVSGGCIEGAVILEAQQSISDGKTRNLEFSVSNEDAWEVGLACGGTIRLFVQPAPTEIDDIVDASAAQRSVALTTNISTGTHQLHQASDAPEAVRRAMQDDQSRMTDDEHFTRVFNTPRRLAVVGAVHIAQELVPMARQIGFDVTVIDPREAFASPERFPEVALSTAWPDQALSDFAPDERSAVVTLTHDPKLDDPALDAALRSSCFYIGSLGSTRTQAKRVARLKEAGFDDATIARIHGPVGLDIGAKSPAEIAVSILGEIISALRNADPA